MSEDQDFAQKVRELTEEVGVAMLTTMTDDGRHVSRPMAVQQTEEDADLWFFTYEDADKVRQLRSHPSANAALSKGHGGPWVSISGTLELVDDRQKIDELWKPTLKAWFPDGKDTPGLIVLRLRAESAEYWEAAGSRIATVISLAKAVVTGETAAEEIGNNESGRL